MKLINTKSKKEVTNITETIKEYIYINLKKVHFDVEIHNMSVVNLYHDKYLWIAN
jgi:hypothetical protein